MIYYLIDYENTGENGLRGIAELNENSCIIIFYSENADKISFDMHQKLMECRASVEYRKISTGKRNALDFQLSTYLGYLIAKCEEDTFYIISKDNGYRVVIDFWKDWDVRQIDRIALSIPKADSSVPPSFMPLPVSEPQELVKPHTSEEGSAVSEPQEPMKPHASEEGSAVSEPQEPMKPHASEEGSAVSEPQELVKPHTSEEGSAVSELQEPVKPRTSEEGSAVSEPQEPVKPCTSEEGGAVSKQQEPVKPQPASASEAAVRAETSPVSTAASETETPTLVNAKMPLSGKELREQVALVITGVEEQENICRFITKYKTKQGVNNAIVKLYGSEKAGELYKKIKPLIKDKKGK